MQEKRNSPEAQLVLDITAGQQERFKKAIWNYCLQFSHGNSVSPAASLASVLVSGGEAHNEIRPRHSHCPGEQFPPCCNSLICLSAEQAGVPGAIHALRCSGWTKCVQIGFIGPAGILRFLCHEAKWEVWPNTTDGFHTPSRVQEIQQPGQTFQPEQIPFFRSPLGIGVRRAGFERILLCPLETL